MSLNDWESAYEKFTDDYFPTTDAIYWADISLEAESIIASNSSNIIWRRASEVYPDRTLWGPNDVLPIDTAQGDLGNCWLIAAMSAFAEYPSRVHDIFHNDEANQSGLYGVNLYVLGTPITVWIDDYLPFVLNYWTKEERLYYSQVGSDNSLWGPLVEKAIAKSVGNFWHLDTGINADGVSILNGGPYEMIQHSVQNIKYNLDEYWELIKNHD